MNTTGKLCTIWSLETRYVHDKEIDLPSYMTPITQEAIDDIINSGEGHSKIIASGVDPRDGSLMIVTGTADVREIKPNGKKRPAVSLPTVDGSMIAVSFVGLEGMHMIDARQAVEVSTSCVSGATLDVNGTELGDLEVETSAGDVVE